MLIYVFKDVTTRGSYLPDKSMATPSVRFASRSLLNMHQRLTCNKNPPLYLHVTSTSKEGLEAAVAKIEELMKQELPNLVDERRFRRRDPPEPVERDEFGRVSYPKKTSQLRQLTPLTAQMAGGTYSNRLGSNPWIQPSCPGCRPRRCLCETHPARDPLSRPDQGSWFRV